MNNSQPPGITPGYAWKNRKLYEFDLNRIMVLKSWPDPRAWTKKTGEAWRHSSRSDANLILNVSLSAFTVRSRDKDWDLSPEARQQDFRQWRMRMDLQILASFCDAIPPSVRHQVRRYTNRRWHMLNLFARCPGSLALSETSPALAYMLANNWVFHKPAVTRPMRSARALVTRSPVEIVKWMGFPDPEFSADILSGIPASDLTVIDLLRLRSLVQRKGTYPPKFKHVNVAGLKLITAPWLARYLTHNLLQEIAEDPEQNRINPPVVRLLRETIRYSQMIGWKDCPHTYSCMDELRDVHDRLASALSPDSLRRQISIRPSTLPSGVIWINDEIDAPEVRVSDTETEIDRMSLEVHSGPLPRGNRLGTMMRTFISLFGIRNDADTPTRTCKG